jgi:hypothetical protein
LVSDVGERSGGISVGDNSAVLGYEDLLLVAFFIGYKVIPQPVRCDLNYACLPQLQFKICMEWIRHTIVAALWI